MFKKQCGGSTEHPFKFVALSMSLKDLIFFGFYSSIGSIMTNR